MPSAVELRFRELANAHDAVATYWLNGGTVASLVARDHAGRIAAAELVEAGGATIHPAAAVEMLVKRREAARRELDLVTDNLVAHLVTRRAAGMKPAELAEVAGRAGMGRSTVYYLLQNAPEAVAA